MRYFAAGRKRRSAPALALRQINAQRALDAAQGEEATIDGVAGLILLYVEGNPGVDLEFVRSLGAKQVIDYKAQRFEEETGEIDLVIDLVAGETRRRSWKVLKPGGMMVSTLGEPEIPGDAPKGARAVFSRIIKEGANVPLFGQ